MKKNLGNCFDACMLTLCLCLVVGEVLILHLICKSDFITISRVNYSDTIVDRLRLVTLDGAS